MPTPVSNLSQIGKCSIDSALSCNSVMCHGPSHGLGGTEGAASMRRSMLERWPGGGSRGGWGDRRTLGRSTLGDRRTLGRSMLERWRRAKDGRSTLGDRRTLGRSTLGDRRTLPLDAGPSTRAVALVVGRVCRTMGRVSEELVSNARPTM